MGPSKPKLDDLRIERTETPEPKSRGWMWIIVLPLLLCAVVAFWWFRPKVLAVQTVSVRASTTKPGERTVLNASGYVTARRSATVSSKVTGKVVEVFVEEGMHVQEGQILARLDDTNTQVSLKLAEAQLESTKNAIAETQVRIVEAEQELERQAALMSNNIATKSDYDHAVASALAYKARLAQQQKDIIVGERQVASWKQQLDDMVIRAPFTGIVTSKNAQPGEMISPVSAGGGFTRTGICTIVDMLSLEIEIDVNESYINRVEPGQVVEASLDAYQDWKIPCKVIAIIPTADRQKSTVKVRVGFDKLDKRILPEMSVKVAFRETEAANSHTAPTGTLMIVPANAIQQKDGRDIVMVVQSGKAERRAVTVSSNGKEESIISAGLNAGERVIVEWPKGLIDGAAVKELKP